jgi:hypothetical protein
MELDKQFWQRTGEPLAAWLLCLWDAGVDRRMLSAQEIFAASLETEATEEFSVWARELFC